MRITKEMVKRGARVRRGIQHQTDEDFVNEVLFQALTAVPEPLGTIITYDPKSPPSAEFPFRLTEEEASIRKWFVSHGSAGIQTLVGALDRAVRTLAAPAVEPLSDKTQEWVSYVLKTCAVDSPPYLVATELRERFPKPAERTAEELADDIRPYLTLTGYAAESLDRLLSLAKAKP